MIPAAGSNARMAGATPKQYLRLAGMPMLYHAVRGLAARRSNVFVVLAPEDTGFARHDWKFEGASSRCTAAARRGATRCITD